LIWHWCAGPPMTANLNLHGLSWLGIALIVCLTAVAVRRTPDQTEKEIVGKRSASVEQVQDTATAVVQQAQTTNGQHAEPQAVRFWAERGLAMLCPHRRPGGVSDDWLAALRRPDCRGWCRDALHAASLHRVQHRAVSPCFAHGVHRVGGILLPARIAVGWLLGLAAGTSVFPALLFPLWFGFYSRRGSMRFGMSFLTATAVSLGIPALILWIGPTGWNLVSALHLTDWKPWSPPPTESIWTGAHWAYRLPVFVLFVGFLVGVTVWPTRRICRICYRNRQPC